MLQFSIREFSLSIAHLVPEYNSYSALEMFRGRLITRARERALDIPLIFGPIVELYRSYVSHTIG